MSYKLCFDDLQRQIKMYKVHSVKDCLVNQSSKIKPRLVSLSLMETSRLESAKPTKLFEILAPSIGALLLL